MPELLKKVFTGVRNEIVGFAEVALISGTSNIGKELANVKRDANQPSNVNLRMITDALKSGVLVTGQELMTRGLERMGISTQDQNSQMDVESTLTQQSMEEV
jgi:hypothetical protein